MAAITQIKVHIHTGDLYNAGTNGFVYLGLCGREFLLATEANDFNRASQNTFFLGSDANVKNAEFNDPRSPQLDTADADRFPAYIRLEPNDDSWNLAKVEVTINPPDQTKYVRLGAGDSNLWLGQNMGKFCYLRKVKS